MEGTEVIYKLTPDFIQQQLDRVEEYKTRNSEFLTALTAYGVDYDVYPQISSYISI